MCRLFRPSKAEPRIHAVVVALESPCKLVRLKATSDADQQVVQDNWRPTLPLDHEILAVPGFEPKFVVLPVGVTLHIQE